MTWHSLQGRSHFKKQSSGKDRSNGLEDSSGKEGDNPDSIEGVVVAVGVVGVVRSGSR